MHDSEDLKHLNENIILSGQEYKPDFRSSVGHSSGEGEK
jgi:hypothetical protein